MSDDNSNPTWKYRPPARAKKDEKKSQRLKYQSLRKRARRGVPEAEEARAGLDERLKMLGIRNNP